ncbi:MAG: hypothetical protein R3Y09_09395 [Clostridia bacterium]
MDLKYFFKLSMLICGNIFAAFGVFLCTISNKGVDPITVLLQGIMNTFNVSIGLASIILHSTLIVICLLLDKKSIKIGTILAVLTFSLSLNTFMATHSYLSFVAQTPAAWLLLIFGIVFMGIGFSIGIFANIGYNTADALLNILSERTNFSIKLCKSLIDLSCFILGIILGGRFGIGTILCVVFVGIVYSATLKFLKNFQLHISNHVPNGELIKENY